MESISIQQMLDAVETLSIDDQEQFADIVRRRVAEKRRNEIARHAHDTLESLRNKTAAIGTLDDLKNDLLSQP